MPGTPRGPSPAQLKLQRAVVARLQAAGHLNDDIAAAAGVDDTMVSKWVTESKDARKMDLVEATRLANHYGWDLVFGSVAKNTRFVTEEWAAVDLEAEAHDLTREAFDLGAALREALADGVLDAREREQLGRIVGHIMARSRKLAAGVQ